MNESTTPPSNDNISATNASISVQPPSLGSEEQNRRTCQSTVSNSNSRRRINIQTAALSESSSSAPSITLPTNIQDADPFDDIIRELDELDSNEADGGDSDVEGEECEVFDEGYVRAMMARNADDTDVHVQQIESGDIAFVIADKGVLDSNNQIDLMQKVHSAPDDWKIPDKKEDGNAEPDFKDVDNPGNWNDFVFRPVYKKTGKGKDAKYKYIRHELPTGCSPVPMKNGKRMVNGWEFFYNGWKSKKIQNARDGASPDDLFPASRKSSLDLDVLLDLGLNTDRIAGPDGLPDALFFFQLILPICDPKHSGIPTDPRKPFYSEVVKFTNLYKYQSGIGSIYGHMIPEVVLSETVQWDGCVFRDGVLGGGNGALYRRWHSGTAGSDDVIQASMSLNRWNQIKRVLKLNNNDMAKKRGEDGYNPSYKYDMIYDVIVSNVISLTKDGELDLTGDETSWGFQGYGEKGGKVVYRFTKPGISKGGQTVIVSATNRIRPYFYQHRNAFS